MSNPTNKVYSFPKLVSRSTYQGWDILEYDVLGKKHYEASKDDNSIILRNYEEVIEMIVSHSDHFKKGARRGKNKPFVWVTGSQEKDQTLSTMMLLIKRVGKNKVKKLFFVLAVTGKLVFGELTGGPWYSRGVAPEEAFTGNRVCGSFQTVQLGRPAFRFGEGGMKEGTWSWSEAWKDMTHYARCGAAAENFKQLRPGDTFSINDIRDIYADPGDGFILTFPGDAVDPSLRYVGNLDGEIDILKPGAQPIGRTPAPMGFDDVGNPVWGEGAKTELLGPRGCKNPPPRRQLSSPKVAGRGTCAGSRTTLPRAFVAADVVTYAVGGYVQTLYYQSSNTKTLISPLGDAYLEELIRRNPVAALAPGMPGPTHTKYNPQKGTWTMNGAGRWTPSSWGEMYNGTLGPIIDYWSNPY